MDTTSRPIPTAADLRRCPACDSTDLGAATCRSCAAILPPMHRRYQAGLDFGREIATTKPAIAAVFTRLDVDQSIRRLQRDIAAAADPTPYGQQLAFRAGVADGLDHQHLN